MLKEFISMFWRQKEYKFPATMPSRGERLLGSLFPNQGTGWPGGWSQNRVEQVLHMKHWVYIAVDSIAKKVGQHMPSCAYLQDKEIPGITTKAHKALSVVNPLEDIQPLSINHPLRELLNNPNPHDTSYDYLYESQMFLELTGVCYTWVVPNKYGTPSEMWCIPSHWVWPRTGIGEFVNPDDPKASRLIDYYEVRPWGGVGSAGILKFPVEEVIMEKWKNPINKIDGYSVLAAIAQWIDSEESITRSRWSQFVNAARPEFWVQLGPGYEDPDEDQLDSIYAMLQARFMGERNYGKPLITPPGAQITPLSFTPQEMAYFQSEEQIRDMILSGFNVPKSVVGVTNEMSYGGILAAMAGFCTFCINPRLSMRGQALTKHLGPMFKRAPKPIRIWWDDCTPSDPQQTNSDITTDMQAHAITPNEVRQLRGRPPYTYGGDDPLVSGPGGIVPLPINTGDDQTDLSELVPTLGAQDDMGMGADLGMGGDMGPAPEEFDFSNLFGEESEPVEIDPTIEEPNDGGVGGMNSLPRPKKGYEKGRGQPCTQGENAIKTGCIPMGPRRDMETEGGHSTSRHPVPNRVFSSNGTPKPGAGAKPSSPRDTANSTGKIVMEAKIYTVVQQLAKENLPAVRDEEDIIIDMVKQFFSMSDSKILEKCAMGTIIMARLFVDSIVGQEYRQSKQSVKQAFDLGEIAVKMVKASHGKDKWGKEDSGAFLEAVESKDAVVVPLEETWVLDHGVAFATFMNLKGIHGRMPKAVLEGHDFLTQFLESMGKNSAFPTKQATKGSEGIYDFVLAVLKTDLQQFNLA